MSASVAAPVRAMESTGPQSMGRSLDSLECSMGFDAADMEVMNLELMLTLSRTDIDRQVAAAVRSILLEDCTPTRASSFRTCSDHQ